MNSMAVYTVFAVTGLAIVGLALRLPNIVRHIAIAAFALSMAMLMFNAARSLGASPLLGAVLAFLITYFLCVMKVTEFDKRRRNGGEGGGWDDPPPDKPTKPKPPGLTKTIPRAEPAIRRVSASAYFLL